MRGIVIHTADQLGTNVGPSYTYGWGLLDAAAAANLITNNYASQSLAFIKEVRLVSGDYIQFPVVLTNNKPFKATIAWTDPPGTPTAVMLNPTNHMLVNDLDLRVISPTSVTNFPWILNRNAPANAATTGDNNVDNVEQVSIPNGGKTWVEVCISTQARRIVLTNLVPGTTYAVRARAIGGSTGASNWTSPGSIMST